MSKNILVTGGAGFIGSHIVEEAVNRGYFAVVVDNLSTGKIENLEHLPKNSYKFIHGDIRDKLFLEQVFNSNELVSESTTKNILDIVFHEAAIASVQKSITDPENSYSVNVLGTKNVFETAVDHGVKTVVFASSAAVYGDDPIIPKKEDMLPKPISPYGEHKLENEKIAARLSLKNNTKFVALRYFNVYGRRQDPKSEYSGVISIFVDRIRSGQGITIYGDGKQTRDFVYVKDVVSANYLVAEKIARKFAVFNVGSGLQTDLNELANNIFIEFNHENNIKYETARDGDIKHSFADIYNIRKETGYKFEYDIKNGLNQLIK